jgi:hypothetical protein
MPDADAKDGKYIINNRTSLSHEFMALLSYCHECVTEEVKKEDEKVHI